MVLVLEPYSLPYTAIRVHLFDIIPFSLDSARPVGGAQNASFNGRPLSLHSWQPADSLCVSAQSSQNCVNPMHSRRDGRRIFVCAAIAKSSAHNLQLCRCQIDTAHRWEVGWNCRSASFSLAADRNRRQCLELTIGGEHWKFRHSRVVSSGYCTHTHCQSSQRYQRPGSAAHTHTRLRILHLPVFFRSKTFSLSSVYPKRSYIICQPLSTRKLAPTWGAHFRLTRLLDVHYLFKLCNIHFRCCH